MPPFLDPVERLILIRDGFYSPDARCHTRAAALLALDHGHPVRSVARSVRCDPDTLKRWCARYLENRDVAALRDGRTRESRRRTRRLTHTRAAALHRLAHAAGAEAAASRLALDPVAQGILQRAASAAEANPTHRYWAALLWAFDRGATISAIARAAVCCRRVVYEAPTRHLPRILAAGAGQGAA